jgi:hypothetical protein
MTLYVGLTDEPDRRRAEHGNPVDWQQTTRFIRESDARDWEKTELSKPGRQGGGSGSGWRYGYWYATTSSTRQ